MVTIIPFSGCKKKVKKKIYNKNARGNAIDPVHPIKRKKINKN